MHDNLVSEKYSSVGSFWFGGGVLFWLGQLGFFLFEDTSEATHEAI